MSKYHAWQSKDDQHDIYINGQLWEPGLPIPVGASASQSDEEHYALHCIRIGWICGLAGGFLLGFFRVMPDWGIALRLLASLGCGAVGFLFGASVGSMYPAFERNEPRGFWFILGIMALGMWIAVLWVI